MLCNVPNHFHNRETWPLCADPNCTGQRTVQHSMPQVKHSHFTLCPNRWQLFDNDMALERATTRLRPFPRESQRLERPQHPIQGKACISACHLGLSSRTWVLDQAIIQEKILATVSHGRKRHTGVMTPRGQQTRETHNGRETVEQHGKQDGTPSTDNILEHRRNGWGKHTIQMVGNKGGARKFNRRGKNRKSYEDGVSTENTH